MRNQRIFPLLVARFFLLSISLAAALLSAEGSLRIFYFGPAGVLRASRYSPRHAGDTHFKRYLDPASSTGLFHDLAPGATGYLKGALFSVNDHGMRDRPFPLKKPAGTFRVAVLGDSYTMGPGVELESIYPKRLERLLGERFEGNFEVLNFGVGGYELEDYAEVLKDKASRFSPDLVVVGFNERNDVPMEPLPDEAETDGSWRGVLTRRALRVHRAFPDGFLPALAFETARNRFYGGNLIRRVEARLDWQRFREEMGLLRRRASSCGASLTVLLLHGLQEQKLPWSDRLRLESAGLGIETVDTVPLFAGKTLSRYWIYASDRHPNARAHAAYARALYEAFLERRIPEKSGFARKTRGSGDAGPER